MGRGIKIRDRVRSAIGFRDNAAELVRRDRNRLRGERDGGAERDREGVRAVGFREKNRGDRVCIRDKGIRVILIRDRPQVRGSAEGVTVIAKNYTVYSR